MKKIFLLLLLVTALQAYSQKKEGMPSEGFWVIENHVNAPKASTVYFYTSSHVLIYKETINGKRLNVNRKKTVRQLNSVLMQSLLAWNRDQVLRQDLQLVRAKH